MLKPVKRHEKCVPGQLHALHVYSELIFDTCLWSGPAPSVSTNPPSRSAGTYYHQECYDNMTRALDKVKVRGKARYSAAVSLRVPDPIVGDTPFFLAPLHSVVPFLPLLRNLTRGWCFLPYTLMRVRKLLTRAWPSTLLQQPEQSHLRRGKRRAGRELIAMMTMKVPLRHRNRGDSRHVMIVFPKGSRISGI